MRAARLLCDVRCALFVFVVSGGGAHHSQGGGTVLILKVLLDEALRGAVADVHLAEKTFDQTLAAARQREALRQQHNLGSLLLLPASPSSS